MTLFLPSLVVVTPLPQHEPNLDLRSSVKTLDVVFHLRSSLDTDLRSARRSVRMRVPIVFHYISPLSRHRTLYNLKSLNFCNPDPAFRVVKVRETNARLRGSMDAAISLCENDLKMTKTFFAMRCENVSLGVSFDSLGTTFTSLPCF